MANNGVPQIIMPLGLDATEYVKGLNELEKKTEQTQKKVETKFSKISGAFKSVAGGVLVANAIQGAWNAVVSTFKASYGAADQFNKKIAEISTILPNNVQITKELKSEMFQLARTYGTSGAQQAGAFYQIISAGITDTAKAMETLNAANKLATAGLGNVETAILGLTKIMNNYGEAAGTAEDISNVLFTAVRNGQVNVEQFSSTLPKVLAEANAMGVSFVGAAAALTALSNTSESADIAATQLKAVFVALSRQMPVLSKIVDENGVAFDRNALASKGLAGYLRDLVRVTKTQEGLMKAIGGSSEAMSAVLKFAADDFKTLQKNVDDFNNSAGITDQALKKIQDASQWDLFVNNIKLSADEFMTSLTPAVEYVAGILNKGFTPRTDEEKLKRLKTQLEEINALIEKSSQPERNAFGNLTSTGRMVRQRAEIQKQIDELNESMNAEQRKADAAAAERKAKLAAEAAEKQKLLEQENAIAQKKKENYENEVKQHIERIKNAKELQTLERQDVPEGESGTPERLNVMRDNLERERLLRAQYKALEAEDDAQRAAALKELQTVAEQAELAHEQEKYEERQKLKDQQFQLEQEKRKRQQEIEQKGQQQFDNAMLSLQNSNLKSLAAVGKAYALWQHGKNAVEAVSNSYRWGSSWGGPPGGAAMAALAAAAMAAQGAQIAGLKGFADGGVIGSVGATAGSDNRLAAVRTGEMILNAEQQEQLFNAIRSGNLGGGGELKITMDENKFMDAFEFELVSRRRQGRSAI